MLPDQARANPESGPRRLGAPRGDCYRRSVRRAPLLLIFVVGCGAEPASEPVPRAWPEPLAGGLVLEWQATDAWGSERFTVTREGLAVFEARIREGDHSVQVERDLDPEAVESLRAELVAKGCCALASLSSAPPEATLRVRMPELSCDLTLPLEAWDEPGAKPCERALRRVHGRPRFRE